MNTKTRKKSRSRDDSTSGIYDEMTAWLSAHEVPMYPGHYEVECVNGNLEMRPYLLGPEDEPGRGPAWGPDVRRWRGLRAPKGPMRKRLSENVHAERRASDKRRAQRDALWLARGHVARAADPERTGAQRKVSARTALMWYQIARELGVDMISIAPLTDAGEGYTQSDHFAFTRLLRKFKASTQDRLRQKAHGFATGKSDYRV